MAASDNRVHDLRCDLGRLARGIAATDIAKTLGLSHATAYRYLNEDNAAGHLRR